MLLVFPYGHHLRYPVYPICDHGADGVLFRAENIGAGRGANAEIESAFAGEQSAADISEKTILGLPRLDDRRRFPNHLLIRHVLISLAERHSPGDGSAFRLPAIFAATPLLAVSFGLNPQIPVQEL
jgi:hypothetical protein